MKMADRRYQYLIWLLMAGVVLVNIKSILVDASIDTSYAMAMSYRMLQGDRMFCDMWEPHQTSAFLCTFLMWIYKKLTGDLSGVLLFLHGVGVIVQGLVTWCVYRTFKEKLPGKIWVLMCIFFMTVRPKDIVFPEFSNMQIWFQILLFLCLLQYFEDGKRRWLIAGSVMLFLEVLVYPSCVLVGLPVTFLIGIYGKKGKEKWKDLGLFIGLCVLQGISYVICFSYRLGGLGNLLAAVQHIVTSDESHGAKKILWTSADQKTLQVVLIWIAVSAAGAAVTCLLSKTLGRCKRIYVIDLTVWLLIMSGVLLFVAANKYLQAAMYLIVSPIAVWGLRFCAEKERRYVIVGLIISLSSVTAALVLSNLGFLDEVSYLVLGIMMAFVPLARILEHFCPDRTGWSRYGVLILFCLMLILRRGVMVSTMGGHGFFRDLGGVIKSGPAAGLISDYMGTRIINETQEEWGQYVQPGDSIMVVGEGGINTLGYLYEDTVVGVHSTICTPTYNEHLLEYWDAHPEKYPDVVTVECWYGDLRVDENKWIMQWLETEYNAAYVQDGVFWRYYRKKAIP